MQIETLDKVLVRESMDEVRINYVLSPFNAAG
jgi:hypothetical protein